MHKNQNKPIPSDACTFRTVSGDTVVSEDKFTLTPYKMGQRVEHPWWGAFMFDVSSMKMGRKVIPVTVDHDTSRGAGYASSMNVSEDGTVSFDGDFVDNEHSKYIKSFKGADVMETSLQFDPSMTEFVYLEEGEFKDVDGVEQEGPLVIFRNAPIIEVAFTLMGAVPNTSTSFSQPLVLPKESAMADDNKSPNTADITKSAEDAMQSKFTRMNEMCPDKGLVATCFSKNMSIEDFSQKVIESLTEENTQFKARIAELETQVASAVPEGSNGVAFSAGAGEQSPEDLGYQALVDQAIASGDKASVAFRKIAISHPDKYEAYRNALK
jgi:hypothetical protein